MLHVRYTHTHTHTASFTMLILYFVWHMESLFPLCTNTSVNDKKICGFSCTQKSKRNKERKKGRKEGEMWRWMRWARIFTSPPIVIHTLWLLLFFCARPGHISFSINVINWGVARSNKLLNLIFQKSHSILLSDEWKSHALGANRKPFRFVCHSNMSINSQLSYTTHWSDCKCVEYQTKNRNPPQICYHRYCRISYTNLFRLLISDKMCNCVPLLVWGTCCIVDYVYHKNQTI